MFLLWWSEACFLSLWICFCFVNKFIYIIKKNRSHVWVISYDICLIYFTYCDNLWVHPCCCRWHYFVFLWLSSIHVHRLNGHEFEEALGAVDGQGSLACCSPWGRKESDTTERLNWVFHCLYVIYLLHPLLYWWTFKMYSRECGEMFHFRDTHSFYTRVCSPGTRSSVWFKFTWEVGQFLRSFSAQNFLPFYPLAKMNPGSEY